MEIVKPQVTKLVEKTNMRCPNCSENKWESVDQHRIKPAGMAICTECGFISYPTKWQSKESIKEHYRNSYRNPPSHQNVYSGERKNHFHLKFLNDLFKKWKAAGIESPRICEIGAAFGFTLQLIKQEFPKAEIYGTELTVSMRRNAYHEFGIKLSEDIDESLQYDLIMSYKVLEHQTDPDQELTRYAKLLKPEGLLYMSVPTWFNSLCNFGMAGFDLEYYYDPNHINVWTEEMFENIFTRAGYSIEKEDQIMYSSTYLLRYTGPADVPVLKLNVEEMKTKMAKIKKAYMAFTENNFLEAIMTWPDYPSAYASHAEMSRKLLAEKGWDYFHDTILRLAIDACPTSAEMVIMATDFAMRAQQWTAATKYAEQALLMKPENPVSLNQLVNIMREMALRAKTPKERTHYFLQAREVARHLRLVSTQHFKEATDLVFFFNSKLPFPGEREIVAVDQQAPPQVEVREPEMAL